MKKLIEKKIQKSTKNQEIAANFEFQPHFQALQNNVLSIYEVYISIYHRLKIISTKNQITSKKTWPFRRKNG